MNDRYEAFSSSGGTRTLYTARMRRIALTALSLASITASGVFAQPTTGAPGSPTATATIDGKKLPPPDPLPAPDGPIYMVMRLYWPKNTPPSILPPGEGTWQSPGFWQCRH